jgi:DNA repair protein RecO (recombination protein O)
MSDKIKAIVLKSVKSGDKDFLVTLFSLEKGIIRAKLKAASVPKAKLKFAKEPFTFADFILAERNGFYTITTADLIDSFYNISSSYEKFLEANEIFKTVLKVLPSVQTSPVMFVNVLKALKMLCYENVQNNLTLAKFYLQLFFSEGYLFSTSACNSCGQKLGMDVFLDFDMGEILCFSCKTPYAQKISFAISKLLKVLAQTDFDNLTTLNVDSINLENVVKVLQINLEKRF